MTPVFVALGPGSGHPGPVGAGAGASLQLTSIVSIGVVCRVVSGRALTVTIVVRGTLFGGNCPGGTALAFTTFRGRDGGTGGIRGTGNS